MNRIFPLLLLLLSTSAAFAQKGKPAPAFKNSASPQEMRINWPGKGTVPTAENPFNLESSKRAPHGSLVSQHAESIRVTLGENGLPIMMEGKTAASGSASESRPVGERALDYLASLNPQGLSSPRQEFVLKSVQTDEQGNQHIRLEQVFQGLPVWGGEVIAHTQSGAFERVNGRYFPTPQLTSISPALDGAQAQTLVKNQIGVEKVKTDWSERELKLIDGAPFSSELVIFHLDGALSSERLVWHVIAHPNVLSRMVYFVDAITGDILDSYDNTCNLAGHIHHESCNSIAIAEDLNTPALAPEFLDGKVTVSGQDLFNVTKTFTLGGWQAGTKFYLENANIAMYNSTTSNMPTDPVGVLVTLDGLNTSPENNNFNYDLAQSSSSTFTNQKAAISAHFNAQVSYDYYNTKHGRAGIDGVGGNILSFVNITESDGTSMENAFWNGAAMWYGNGGSTFKPLARGVDVGGHEMTHGVVEKTANLVYQDESGALNESFADVFGVLIENDSDWKIGEDVMQTGGGLPTALRDLSNPHNGFTSSSSWWQPNHVNEKYTGSQDNGGVHINSGIPNYAFYLFASNASVGKDKAERVYYKALRDYLTKNSKFVDCRIAVIQAATDLYGASIATIAANAFTTVGIGGSTPSGNYLGQLSPNPGSDFVLCASNDLQNLDLALGSNQVLGSLYTDGVLTRPSITDNGLDLVFVNSNNQIVGISMDYSVNPIEFTTTVINDQSVWRGVAISKDGRFLAGLSSTQEPVIYIYDFITAEQQDFSLYNPTYSEGQVTGDVKYADVLEFDYSGKNLMYDSFNELSNTQGQDLSYWDIGFLEFWDNGQFAPKDNAFISKLFTGIPENTSIGNPTFAKNSPFIIAFDYIDNNSFNTVNDIYGANSETGDYNVIVSNNGALGWPNYNRLDTKLLYETNPSNGIYNIRLQGLNANKIQPSGSSTPFISNHSWGVWYGNGNRSLKVDAPEPALAPLSVSVSPNPVTDFTQISMTALHAADAQITVCNLFGQVMTSRSASLLEGENLLDFDMSALPAGTYIIKISAEESGAAVKVIKR